VLQNARTSTSNLECLQSARTNDRNYPSSHFKLHGGFVSETTRREFLKDTALASAGITTAMLTKETLFASAKEKSKSSPAHPDPTPASVMLHWLGKDLPTLPTGVSLGVPWAKGQVHRDSQFHFSLGNQVLPLQSWPLAYWPDGSVKWSGFATVLPAPFTGELTLSPGAASSSGSDVLGTLQVKNDGKSILVDTGSLQCSIPVANSTNFIHSITVQGRNVVDAGQLVCILQTGPEGEADQTRPREKFTGTVRKVTVEQSGPVRAVVKFEGIHKGETSGREWLPFHVRLYFYSGQTAIRLVHTIMFDGDQEKDFIHGLGVTFAVPMREEIQNRHVRFSGTGEGLWSEPIQPLIGRGGPRRMVEGPNGQNVYATQLEGQRVPNRNEMTDAGRDLLDHWAIWDDFKLTQLDHTGFSVRKRTNPQSTWLFSAAGERSSGYVFAGDVSGGLGVSVKNFWQSHPAELLVQRASSPTAQLTAWLWSPESPAMDLRHYDTRAHGLLESYEDVQPGNSTPYGIARTSELMLWPTGEVPVKSACAEMAKAGTELPMLLASPEYYHGVRACGLWSLPDASTPFKAAIEKNLDTTLALYLNQIEQRHWYGFWNYGDVVHSFDRGRHVWRYDLGGMAWDNSELGTDTWLWYSFLRTGRADLFRMAEAMTRHTGEVDSYHFGPMMGLGTRHGVSHWGDGAKEARIGQAAFRRYYYYLTTDERTGDIMRDALQAENSVVHYDPMRLADPPRPEDPKFAARLRMGPDWLALVSNWMTEWERTGNTKYRDKILTGMKSIVAMPHGFRTGKNLVAGFDPATGNLTARDSSLGDYNLTTIMGGAEVMFELNLSIDDDAWKKVWVDFCSDSGTTISDGKLKAYAYSVTKNPALAQSAIASLRTSRNVHGGHVDPPDALASMDDGTDTNGASQGSLNAIAVLEFCAHALPTAAPDFPERSFPGRHGA
jgi:hypothetical protein